MGLKGSFDTYQSPRAGGMKKVGFVLTCDNMFQKESFDAAIMSADGVTQPMVFRGLELDAKRSFRFDYDTVGWDWCNGDSFCILGKKDSVKKRWEMKMQQYAPGECPDCHGSQKCSYCSGRGFVRGNGITLDQCPHCYGTGVCQRCHVSQRNPVMPVPTAYDNTGTGNMARRRQCDAIRQRIAELQEKIRQTEWDMQLMQLRDRDVKHHSVFSSYNRLLFEYRRSVTELQSQLYQLENM